MGLVFIAQTRKTFHTRLIISNAHLAMLSSHIFCDPYSNPQPQEILQILPHPVWGEYGYPTEKGQGWIGDPRTWELDVGRLSQTLYFYLVVLSCMHSLFLQRLKPQGNAHRWRYCRIQVHHRQSDIGHPLIWELRFTWLRTKLQNGRSLIWISLFQNPRMYGHARSYYL